MRYPQSALRQKQLGELKMVKATCRPMYLMGIEDCDDCPHGQRHLCNILSLTYDLTTERHVCPLDDTMEKCVVDQVYLPHVLKEIEQ